MPKNKKTQLLKVIFLSASGFFLLVCMDSSAKYLGNIMPVTQVVWGRFFFHFFAFSLYFILFRPKLNLKKNFKIQIIRSVLMVTATFSMFISLQRFDLVDIYVVFFTAPLIVSLLSAYFLKDILSFEGTILMLLSFIAIFYSLGPDMKILSPELIFPIVTALCWATYQFFTKLISENNEPFTAVFYTAVLGAFVFTIYISFNWLPLENKLHWIGLIMMGVFGFISHLIIIYAIQLSNLSFITNFQYSQLLWSTIINFLIFGIPLDLNKIFGVIGVIIFGILFIRVEGKKKFK